MLETLVVVLLILWAMGLATGTGFGGFIHLLLLAAAAVFVIRIVRGRSPV